MRALTASGSGAVAACEPISVSAACFVAAERLRPLSAFRRVPFFVGGLCMSVRMGDSLSIPRQGLWWCDVAGDAGEAGKYSEGMLWCVIAGYPRGRVCSMFGVAFLVVAEKG